MGLVGSKKPRATAVSPGPVKEVIVVGDEYCGDVISGLRRGSYEVKLVREPKNSYDKNAIAVHYRSARIGYLSSGQAAKFCSGIDKAGGTIATSMRGEKQRGFVSVQVT